MSPEPNTGCWLWTGAVDPEGYGFFWVGGQRKNGGRQWRAPRAALLLAGMDVQESAVVCHSCDMPGCVNPAHLFVGTQKDNMQDKVRKGRSAAQKVTHCPHGHPYSGTNLRINRHGHRICIACNKASNLKWRESHGN